MIDLRSFGFLPAHFYDLVVQNEVIVSVYVATVIAYSLNEIARQCFFFRLYLYSSISVGNKRELRRFSNDRSLIS